MRKRWCGNQHWESPEPSTLRGCVLHRSCTHHSLRKDGGQRQHGCPDLHLQFSRLFTSDISVQGHDLKSPPPLCTLTLPALAVLSHISFCAVHSTYFKPAVQINRPWAAATGQALCWECEQCGEQVGSELLPDHTWSPRRVLGYVFLLRK